MPEKGYRPLIWEVKEEPIKHAFTYRITNAGGVFPLTVEYSDYAYNHPVAGPIYLAGLEVVIPSEAPASVDKNGFLFGGVNIHQVGIDGPCIGVVLVDTHQDPWLPIFTPGRGVLMLNNPDRYKLMVIDGANRIFNLRSIETYLRLKKIPHHPPKVLYQTVNYDPIKGVFLGSTHHRALTYRHWEIVRAAQTGDLAESKAPIHGIPFDGLSTETGIILANDRISRVPSHFEGLNNMPGGAYRLVSVLARARMSFRAVFGCDIPEELGRMASLDELRIAKQPEH